MGDKLDIFSSKIDTLSSINKEKVSEIFLKLEHITTRIDKLEEHKAQPKQYFKEKIAQKIRKSSKEYVKNLTLNLIRKYERISGLKLREIIVEEQGLSSKSSFYRILEEIEKTEEDLAIMREGKEKIFISKLAKKPN
jgi:hypothetical protein